MVPRRLALLAVAVLLGAAGLALAGRRQGAGLAVAAPIVVAGAVERRRDTLKQGESLGALFQRHGLGPLDLAEPARLLGLDARRLQAGLVFDFRRGLNDSLPTQVAVRTGPEERVLLVRAADAWRAERQPVRWRTELVRVAGEISSNLYEALDANVPETELSGGERVQLAWDLADVYAWSLDFTRDIQPGDRFAVLVEQRVSEEDERRLGRILAGELITSGRSLGAFRFDSPAGAPAFYDAEGRSLRRAFLRSPVQFRRISSGFARSRLHPVLGIWRSHQGTDYAAASGTPVLAAGDGNVLGAGWSGGYGRMVELRHLNGITTRYAHLLSFARGVRPGTRVRQGDVIGFVGASGLVTATHLHYEFRINGVARDSRRVQLGPGLPVADSLLAGFRAVRDRLTELLRGPRPPAVADTGSP